MLGESLRECVRVGTRMDKFGGHHVHKVIVHPPIGSEASENYSDAKTEYKFAGVENTSRHHKIL